MGGLFFGALSEKLGRRRSIVIAALLALPALPFWAFASTPLILGAGAFLMQVAVQGAWGVIPAHLNELSPPEIRATFPGVVYQLGNLLAAVNLNLQVLIAGAAGSDYGLAMAIVVGCVALVIILMMVFGPEKRGISMAGASGQALELVGEAVRCVRRGAYPAGPRSSGRSLRRRRRFRGQRRLRPGNSTELIAACFPKARITGIDTSTDMVEAARLRLPALRFEVADIRAWACDPGENPDPADLIFANAIFEWCRARGPVPRACRPALCGRLPGSPGARQSRRAGTYTDARDRAGRTVAAETRRRRSIARADRTGGLVLPFVALELLEGRCLADHVPSPARRSGRDRRVVQGERIAAFPRSSGCGRASRVSGALYACNRDRVSRAGGWNGAIAVSEAVRRRQPPLARRQPAANPLLTRC